MENGARLDKVSDDNKNEDNNATPPYLLPSIQVYLYDIQYTDFYKSFKRGSQPMFAF